MTLDENGVLCDLYGEPVTQGMLELEREQHCVLCVHYYVPESLCQLLSIGKNPNAWCEHFAWNQIPWPGKFEDQADVRTYRMVDDVNARRSSAEHDAPMTRESIDQAIKDAIADALENHRPKTDPKLIFTIAFSSIGLLVTMIGGLIVQSNRLVLIEERQAVNSGLILKLSERIDANEALLHNDESAISQTAQRLTDHVDVDNARWERVGGKREKP